jgi:hypothetical protein
MTRTLKGKMIGALCIVRLGRCQWGSKKGMRQCTFKTRCAIAMPVIDADDLVGVRMCGEHIEAAVEALRK